MNCKPFSLIILPQLLVGEIILAQVQEKEEKIINIMARIVRNPM
jgi:hypothetical protein